MSLNRVLSEPAAGKSGLSGLLCRPVGGILLFWGDIDMGERKFSPVHNSQGKYQTYNECIKQYNKAMQLGFYYQAIFLDYAMLEDRLWSFLYHMGVFINRQSFKVDKKASKPLSDLVNAYHRPKETTQWRVKTISGKMRIIRCTVEWMTTTDTKPTDKYLEIIKNHMETLDLAETLNIIAGIEDWCMYRNEMTHSLFNKELCKVKEKEAVIAKEGMQLARRLDQQVKELKKGEVIRKKLNLQIENPSKTNLRSTAKK